MLYGCLESINSMELTDRQKEIVINYLYSVRGEKDKITPRFVVMREELDQIINILKAKN